jgi:hypothetical protein
MTAERTRHRIEADLLDAWEAYIRWSLNVKFPEEGQGSEFLQAFERYVLSLSPVDDEGNVIDADGLKRMGLWRGMRNLIVSRGPGEPPN